MDLLITVLLCFNFVFLLPSCPPFYCPMIPIFCRGKIIVMKYYYGKKVDVSSLASPVESNL